MSQGLPSSHRSSHRDLAILFAILLNFLIGGSDKVIPRAHAQDTSHRISADLSLPINIPQAEQHGMLPIDQLMAVVNDSVSEAGVCPGGYVPEDIYYQSFDGSSLDWDFEGLPLAPELPPSPNLWGLSALNAASGAVSLFGSDNEVNSDSVARMRNYVTLPTGRTLYLRFNHDFQFEGPDHEGGVVEYSANFGAWTDLSPHFDGIDYNGPISSSNPLSVADPIHLSAFVGDSQGYGSSRYDITRFAGDKFYIRFRTATDSSSPFELGWFVDDVEIYSCVPEAPQLDSPTDGSIIHNKTPTFNWGIVPPAVAYTLQFSTFSNFDPAESFNTDASPGASQSYTLSTPLPDTPNTTYYWHVRASDTNNLDSAWSETYHFTLDTQLPPAPILSSPSTGTVFQGNPSFKWMPSATAVAYWFQYASDASFTLNLFTSPAVTSTTYTPPTPMPQGVYYWHVQSQDAAGNLSAWSVPRTVSIKPLLPAAPIQIAPATSLLTNTSPVTLTWGSTANAQSHQVQVDNNSTFTSPEVDQAVSVTSYQATGLPDGIYAWRVRGINIFGSPGAWSTVRSFTLDTTPPSAPILNTPTEGANSIGMPIFTWNPVTGAVAYQFQSAVNNVFTAGVKTTSQLTGTTYTPALGFVGTLYWRARARDAAGNWSVWSTGRSVTINPSMPAIPTMINPVGFLTGDSTPTLSWNAAAYATSYEVQIAKLSTFALTSIEQNPPTVAGTSYDADTLSDGVHYWRVRSVNGVGDSNWSIPRSFTVDTKPPNPPVLVSPANGAQVSGMPTFLWKGSTGAVRYKLQYAADSGFTNILFTSPELATVSYKPVTNDTGILYWRVQAKDAAGNWGLSTSPADVWSVNIVSIILTSPTLANPANASLMNDNTPRLSWNPVPLATTYQIQIATSSTFYAIRIEQDWAGLPGTSYDAASLSDGRYYWRVRAANGGIVSLWSMYRSFTIDTVPPPPPTLKTPIDGAIVTGMPIFSWVATNYTTYRLQYATDSDFTNILFTSPELTKASYKPPTGDQGVLYWRVQAKDKAGNWSNWIYSPIRSVTVQSVFPPSPVLLTPTNGTVLEINTVTLTWNPAASAATYDLKIDNDASFASPEVDLTGLTATISLVALPEGTYYWRVRAVNGIGNPGPWSATWTFSTPLDDSAPSPPSSLTSPTHTVGGTDTTNNIIEVDWSDDASDGNGSGIAGYAGVWGANSDTDLDTSTLQYGPEVFTEISQPLVNGTWYFHLRVCDVSGNCSETQHLGPFILDLP